MAVAGKANWKMRGVVAFIAAVLVFLVFIFSDWGRQVLEEKMTRTFNETPPDEQIDLSTADRWFWLAWWQGSILGNKVVSYRLYEDWLGVLNDPKSGEDFIDYYEKNKRYSFNGKFKRDKNGRCTGWGMMHPRAPEVLYSYIQLYKIDETSSYVSKKVMLYRILFFDLYPSYSKTGKPHPNAYKYVQKMEDEYLKVTKGMRLFDPKKPKPPKPSDFPGPAE